MKIRRSPIVAALALLTSLALPPDHATAQAVFIRDGWNLDVAFTPQIQYGGIYVGFEYTPTETYELTRVEFYESGSADWAELQIREDNGSGFPTGPILSSVEYWVDETAEWAGGELNPPVIVHAGTKYFLRYKVPWRGTGSTTDNGAVIPHSGSNDGVNWNGPWSAYGWVARFWGSQVTPTETSSFSRVKALYE